MPMLEVELPDLPGVRVLWDPDQIRNGIRTTLVKMVDTLYPDRTETLALIGVLKGAQPLFDEVFNYMVPLYGNMRSDTVESSLYGDGVVPTKDEPDITKHLEHPVRGANVLLVEDIVDTGKTLKKIVADLFAKGAKTVRVLALCRRTSARALVSQVEHLPEGLEIIAIFELNSEEFVIGFGLDFAGKYRKLPYVAAFDASRLPPAA